MIWSLPSCTEFLSCSNSGYLVLPSFFSRWNGHYLVLPSFWRVAIAEFYLNRFELIFFQVVLDFQFYWVALKFYCIFHLDLSGFLLIYWVLLVFYLVLLGFT